MLTALRAMLVVNARGLPLAGILAALAKSSDAMLLAARHAE
jgi:hypothetical protein